MIYVTSRLGILISWSVSCCYLLLWMMSNRLSGVIGKIRNVWLTVFISYYDCICSESHWPNHAEVTSKSLDAASLVTLRSTSIRSDVGDLPNYTAFWSRRTSNLSSVQTMCRSEKKGNDLNQKLFRKWFLWHIHMWKVSKVSKQSFRVLRF